MNDATGLALAFDNNYEPGESELTPREFTARKSPDVEKVPSWHFVSDGVRLLTAHPVPVFIESAGESHHVNCPLLHVFATASSRAAALEDLTSQVIYFYKRYTSMRPDQVTGLAAELRHTYISRFQLTK